MTAQEIEVIEAEIDGAGPGQDQEVLTETEETLVVEGTDIEGETGDVIYSFLRIYLYLDFK